VPLAPAVTREEALLAQAGLSRDAYPNGYAPEIYFPPVPVLPWTPAQIKIHRDADWRMAQITFVQCLKSLWRAARLTWKLWRRDYRPEPPLLPTR
jgi:hypothetical protein